MSAETSRLLRESPEFARLWYAEIISLGGDWFTLIALAVTIARGSGGSGLAVSALLVTQLLPMVVLGPWSGALVDRFDRRRLLIASDLGRAALVLLLIPAASAGNLPLLYLLAFLHFCVATVFEPGRAAWVPSLVASGDLVRASTLSTVTWSVMAAVGGFLGGSVLAAVGTAAAFGIDALTFLASAALIASIPSRAGALGRRSETHGPGVLEGIRYLRRRPVVAATALVKSINGVATIDTLMVLYATRLFAGADGGARSLGLFWGAFGLGALLGPLALNRINDGSNPRMRRFVAVGACLLTLGLALLAVSPVLGAVCGALLLRGAGGSTNWTFSTILLQKSVPDGLLGRVFAFDFACAQLTAMVFSLFWGGLADRVELRSVVLLAAGLSLLPLFAWTVNLGRLDRRESAEAVGG